MDVAYYQHSGKCPLSGLLLCLLTGSLASALLGAIYAYAILYIPMDGLISFILTGTFGLLSGIAIGKLMRRSHIRSLRAGRLCLLFCQSAGYYVSWAVWVFAVYARAGLNVSLIGILIPPVLWHAILQVNETGVWSPGGKPLGGPLGGQLWIFWVAEAAFIFYFSWLGLAKLNGTFCERCGVWCNEHDAVATLHPMQPDELRTVLEQRDYERLELATESIYERIQLDLQQCPQCLDTCTVTGKLIQVTLKNGYLHKLIKSSVKQLLISRDEATALRHLHLLKNSSG
ncbi:hypothetical protein IV102_36960 [bacterium]|nr:hypothetical protein [bacterium]